MSKIEKVAQLADFNSEVHQTKLPENVPEVVRL